jgi:putative phosphoesterase
MKLFIISDIHGSLSQAEKAVKAYQASQAGSLIILGDFYYHGPRNPLPTGYDPMGVSKLLNPLSSQIIAIKGNCDAEVDEFISQFPFHQDYYIRLPNKKSLYLAHGHHPLPRLKNISVVLTGHTHIASIEKKDGVIFANPGSISLPKAENSCDYILLDDTSITLFDLESGQKISQIDF